MLETINLAAESIDRLSQTKPIKVISHSDTDGIASAAIFSRALQRWNKKFSLQIVKDLDEQTIKSLPESHILIFLDLASGSLSHLKNKSTEIFIFDHHEITQDIPENVTMVNSRLTNSEQISGAGIAYFAAKKISPQNTDLAQLAIIGMVGDVLEKNIGKAYEEILKDAETILKKGLLLYPSTRPLDKTLEYSSNPYIPSVTGSYRGAVELLKEANIPKINGRYKSLHELSEEEMSSLITAVMLRGIDDKNLQNIIGNIFLIKFFNKLEDARELSALINACSRMDHPALALGFCLGNKKCKEEAEKIYIEYRQHLVSALKYIHESEKIVGKDYIVINAKDQIKDTIIGTVASIMSNSPTYTEGTIIIALAYSQDKIKISARNVGKGNRNVMDVLNKSVIPLGGNVEGHQNAAGCLITKENEPIFLEELKKVLEIELVKV